jgi:hypothetical protein
VATNIHLDHILSMTIPRISMRICFDARFLPDDVDSDDDTRDFIYDDATYRMVYNTM